MNSTELIEFCKKTFQDYHEERESFEDELINYLYLNFRIIEDRKEVVKIIQYFISSCKSFHWRSFYNGYLKGATQHLKDD